MAGFKIFGSRSQSPTGDKKVPEAEHAAKEGGGDAPAHPDATNAAEKENITPHPDSHPAGDNATHTEPPAPVSSAASAVAPAEDHPADAKKPDAPRRFSWMPLGRGGNAKAKPAAPEQDKKATPAPPQIARTRSQKQAQQSALLLRDLIIGPSVTPSGAGASKHKSKLSISDVEKAKAQLAHPKSANKVIAELRQLASSDVPAVVGTGPHGESLTALSKGPIHAVCLPYPDAEAHDRHFCRLAKDDALAPAAGEQQHHQEGTTTTIHVQASSTTTTAEITSVANASITTLKTVFSEINLVSLITTPDLGLGGAPDGPGILSGALPSAQALISGIEQITPQLMALGYATGKAVVPDHAGVYPPTDRMSAITYWWGFEIVMPQPSLQYLDNVPSISHTVINFLSALSVVEGGVREIMPFVRYISTFIDTEFSMIKEQDEGQGVVCAATWIMPAALVPRPWDFTQPPPKSDVPASSSGDSDVQDVPTTPPTNGQDASAPEQTSVPIIVTPDSGTAQAGAAQAEMPEVKVTPPTPPASVALQAQGASQAPAVPAVA